MEYLGHVKNGVVVLEGSPPLAEGTRVRVSPFPNEQGAPRDPSPGSADAILGSTARWHGPPEELDQLLEELRRTKWAEVEKQRHEPGESLDGRDDLRSRDQDTDARGS